MISWSRTVPLWFAAFAAAHVSVVAPAADADRPPAPALPYHLSRLEGLQIQSTDEPLESFVPLKSETVSESNRSAALAHYMAGRLKQENRDLKGALKSYLQALKFDSHSLDPYQAAIPILLQQGDIAQARKLSLQAAKDVDEGVTLVQTLAAILARQNQPDESITLLTQALDTPGLLPGSARKLALHRDLGLYYRLTNKFPEAAEHYQIVFDAVLNPKTEESIKKKVLQDPGKNFDEFGDVFLKAKMPEHALKAFEEASKYREEKPGLHSFNLATVFQQTGKPEKALEELQGYFDAQLQSRGRAAFDLLKELLTELKRDDELIPRLEQIYEKDPHNEVLQYYLADELLALNEIDRAEKLYRKGRENVTDPRALVGIFAIERRRDDPKALLEVLTKAFQTVPRGDDEKVLQQLAPDVRALSQHFEEELTALKEDESTINTLFDYARSLKDDENAKLEFIQAYILGQLAREGDFTDSAIDFYRLAISMRNDPPALLYQELGSHLLDTQRYDDAIKLFNEAINHPSNGLQQQRWLFLFFLSYAYEFEGETKAALAAVKEAQQLNPSVARLQYQEAWIIYHARRWDEALELFEKFIQDHATDADLVQDARFRISNIYVEKGDMAKGEQILEEVLKDDPASTQANNDLGYLWADQGKNLDRAHDMIKKALDADPDNPAYLDSMGWVLYKQGDHKEAVTYLQKAAEHKQGKDATIYDHLADCLMKLGRKKEALKYWQEALELEKEKTSQNEKLLKSIQDKLGEHAE